MVASIQANSAVRAANKAARRETVKNDEPAGVVGSKTGLTANDAAANDTAAPAARSASTWTAGSIFKAALLGTVAVGALFAPGAGAASALQPGGSAAHALALGHLGHAPVRHGAREGIAALDPSANGAARSLLATPKVRAFRAPTCARRTNRSLLATTKLRAFAPPKGAKRITSRESNAGIATAEPKDAARITSAKRSILQYIKDRNIQNLAIAIGGTESKFDINEVKRDQETNRKKGTLAEELGIFRMNRDMLRQLGYSEPQIAKIQNGDAALSARAFERGVRRFGRTRFLLWHRGGTSARDRFNAGTATISEDREYVDAVNRIQASITKAMRTNTQWIWVSVRAIG